MESMNVPAVCNMDQSSCYFWKTVSLSHAKHIILTASGFGIFGEDQKIRSREIMKANIFYSLCASLH